MTWTSLSPSALSNCVARTPSKAARIAVAADARLILCPRASARSKLTSSCGAKLLAELRTRAERLVLPTG